MNKEDYSLEKLEKTFLGHHEAAFKHHLEVAERYRKEYGEEYPHPYFSISLALYEICKEINYLKKGIINT